MEAPLAKRSKSADQHLINKAQMRIKHWAGKGNARAQAALFAFNAADFSCGVGGKSISCLSLWVNYVFSKVATYFHVGRLFSDFGDISSDHPVG